MPENKQHEQQLANEDNVLQLVVHICHEWVSCPGSYADESFDDSLVMNSCDVFIP